MQLGEMRQLLLDLGVVKNHHYFNRYFKLIEYYVSEELKKSRHDNNESHHILPRAICPEFIKEKWNLVLLPAKAHYLAHYMLYRSIRHRSCVFAFNQMQRTLSADKRLKCRLYKSMRSDLSALLSELAKNRMQTAEEKKKKSKSMSGTNTYRNRETGELKRIKVGTEPAGWEPFQTGRKHSEATKQTMSINKKGRRWQYNELTKEIKFEHELLSGFTVGYPSWLDYDKSFFRKLSWVHNEETGEALR